MRILLADDSAASRYLLQRAVEGLGHECLLAEDGIQAWERYLETSPEVVISDWIMPGLDGDELCRRIRQDPESRYTYFVMLTSLEDKSHVLRGMHAGVDDYLTKPLNGPDLEARLIAASRVTALHHQIVEQQRELEHEVAMAANIQQGMLPAEPPDVPAMELAGRCLPAAKVGGDYFDLLPRGDGRGIVALVADVAGHSIGSALMMAMARSVLRAEAAKDVPAATLLRATNAAMFTDLERAGLFITAFCANLGSDGTLTYANAGHNLPLLRRVDGSVEELDADGAAIGFLDDLPFEQKETTLAPGEMLLLYTDGVVEAPGVDDTPYGDERLIRLVSDATGTAEELMQAVLDDVADHLGGAAQGDDVTVVALRVTGER